MSDEMHVGEKLAARDKYWSECSTADQIERLRACVYEQERTIQRLSRMLDALQDHRHDPALGILLTPLLRNGREWDSYGDECSWRMRLLDAGKK